MHFPSHGNATLKESIERRWKKICSKPENVENADSFIKMTFNSRAREDFKFHKCSAKQEKRERMKRRIWRERRLRVSFQPELSRATFCTLASRHEKRFRERKTSWKYLESFRFCCSASWKRARRKKHFGVKFFYLFCCNNKYCVRGSENAKKQKNQNKKKLKIRATRINRARI